MLKVVQRLVFLLVAALLSWLPAAPVAAHELPYDVVTYLTLDGGRLHVLLRVPMPLLVDARLPTRNGGYLDLAKSDEPLRVVALDVARNLDLMNNNRPLPAPTTVRWAVTRRPDAAFDSYDAARARFMQPALAVDTPVDPAKAAVDVQLEYVLGSGTPDLSSGARDRVGPTQLSIRVNGFRAQTRAVQMVVHYAGGATPRTFIMTGNPRRVDLEPGWGSVAPIFARLGLERLALGAEHLLFILCLAIPLRRWSAAFATLGAFAAGYVVSLAIASLLPGQPAASTVQIVQALVAAALIVATLQNITAPRFGWVAIVAGVFGLVDGLGFGFAYRQGLPLAGAHTLVSFVSFAGPVLFATLWLLILIRPLVGLIYRSPVPARWAILCLSAIPIHYGLHGIMALSGS